MDSSLCGINFIVSSFESTRGGGGGLGVKTQYYRQVLSFGKKVV